MTDSVVGSARDLDILESIAWARFLSTAQIQSLHFPSRRTAQRRLRALLDHGQVRAMLQGDGVLHKANLYMLTPLGAERLVEAGIGDAESVRAGRAPRPQKLRHALLVRDVFVEHRLAERHGAFELIDFKFEGDLATDAMFRAAGIVPDALAILRGRAGDSTRGVEVDCGTETTTTLRSKLSAWGTVLRNMPGGELLVVVLGATRGRTCMRLASEAGVEAAVVMADELREHLRRDVRVAPRFRRLA